ncbi:MAG: hypothetical protein KME10_27930 [Plectolyngbya sp. WJT66-NPBG17]|nr:hypothetical protein [Plectolyngbya sp. WJT66-NPBG17]
MVALAHATNLLPYQSSAECSKSRDRTNSSHRTADYYELFRALEVLTHQSMFFAALASTK